MDQHANKKDSGLALIRDVTNTNKHWGRDEGKRVAWVSRLFRSSADARVSVFVTIAEDDSSVKCDASELADAGIKERRELFHAHLRSESV